MIVADAAALQLKFCFARAAPAYAACKAGKGFVFSLKNAAAITRKSILARPLGLKAVTWFSLPQYTQNVLCHNSTNDQPSFTP